MVNKEYGGYFIKGEVGYSWVIEIEYVGVSDVIDEVEMGFGKGTSCR